MNKSLVVKNLGRRKGRKIQLCVTHVPSYSLPNLSSSKFQVGRNIQELFRRVKGSIIQQNVSVWKYELHEREKVLMKTDEINENEIQSNDDESYTHQYTQTSRDKQTQTSESTQTTPTLQQTHLRTGRPEQTSTSVHTHSQGKSRIGQKYVSEFGKPAVLLQAHGVGGVFLTGHPCFLCFLMSPLSWTGGEMWK